MTSNEMRNDFLFMRNTFQTAGKWDIPLIKNQKLPVDTVELISCSDTKFHDSTKNKNKGVHFFVDDYRFYNTYTNPEKSLEKFAQYAFLLTPDFSTYADMNRWRQLESIAHSRWVGAYWQSKGLVVIPSITWSDPRSFEFCFDGIEKGSTVAIGMIGCKSSKLNFMRGYTSLLNKIEPSSIICYGNPFPEMKGNLIVVDYLTSRRNIR